MFSARVIDQWIPAWVDEPTGDQVLVSVDPTLTESRAVSLLRVDGGPTLLTVTPARAHDLGVADRSRIEPAELTTRLVDAAVVLNDPDHLFYLSRDAQAAVSAETVDDTTRRLGAGDAAAFGRFTAQAPEEDLDEAFVELDHWLVVGTVVGDVLGSVASAYPWSGTPLADVGVITLPAYQGRGLGRATVRALSAAVLAAGHEPQYRCQLDHAASVALAAAAGFSHFGRWEVLAED